MIKSLEVFFLCYHSLIQKEFCDVSTLAQVHIYTFYNKALVYRGKYKRHSIKACIAEYQESYFIM